MYCDYLYPRKAICEYLSSCILLQQTSIVLFGFNIIMSQKSFKCKNTSRTSRLLQRCWSIASQVVKFGGLSLDIARKRAKDVLHCSSISASNLGAL
jgi:hypothetical protein